MTDRTHSGSNNNLDLLRLVFALLVLLSHAPELIDGNRNREVLSLITNNVKSFGELAVEGFFALSGYLIMASWLKQPNLIEFFKKRILRIYPAFLVAFCVSVLIIGPVAAYHANYFESFDLRRFLLTMLTLRDPWFAHGFPRNKYTAVNAAMWTIMYEFICYTAVASIGFIAGRQLKQVWFFATATLLIVACALPELHSMHAIYMFQPQACIRLGAVFFTGATLQILAFQGFRSTPSNLLVGLVFGVSLFSLRLNVAGSAIFGSMFFISVGLANEKLNLMKRWPDISYGTYLYGWPVLQIIIWLWPSINPWVAFALSAVSSLFCGYLSWTFVEAPFMKLKKKVSNTPEPLSMETI